MSKLGPFKAKIEAAIEQMDSIVRGHKDVLAQIWAAILAGGHILLEDVPGVGKTTLAKSLATTIDASFSRIQFTADMLPSDVLGALIYQPQSQQLSFRKGPIFSELILADEINRASPKTQSAFLEAMAESSVTVDDTSYRLTDFFMIIATQNPQNHQGVYPLPESQLDRFLISLSLGYPSRAEEKKILLSEQIPSALKKLSAVITVQDILVARTYVDGVYLSDAVADYILNISDASRHHEAIALGLSPRGVMAYGRMVKAWALLQDRDHVLADDVQQLAPALLSHRLFFRNFEEDSRAQKLLWVKNLLETVAVPRHNATF